jgi:hypothetical protein
MSASCPAGPAAAQVLLLQTQNSSSSHFDLSVHDHSSFECLQAVSARFALCVDVVLHASG